MAACKFKGIERSLVQKQWIQQASVDEARLGVAKSTLSCKLWEVTHAVSHGPVQLFDNSYSFDRLFAKKACLVSPHHVNGKVKTRHCKLWHSNSMGWCESCRFDRNRSICPSAAAHI